MKWKSDVKINKNDEYIITLGTQQKAITKEDEFIADVIARGEIEESKLIHMVSKKEGTDELIAQFRLAQFVVDYGDFIENPKDFQIIES